MTMDERTKELKEIMNKGFQTKNNYVSNKIGTVSWIVDKDFNETGLLMAIAAKNIKESLENEFDDVFVVLELTNNKDYRCFKIMGVEDLTNNVEIECIEWTDQTETMIRIHSWEDNLSETDPESKQLNKEIGDLITEFVAQQLEM